MSFSSFFSNCLNHLSVDAQNHAADLRMMFRQLKSLLAGSGPRRRSLRSLRAAAWLSISPAEALEQRINLASFSLSGTSGSGTATITLANNESLTVLANTSSSYTFTLGSGSWTGTAANGVSASGTTLTANSTAQTFYSTFTITKASTTTGTSVTFANSGTTNTFKDAFNVTMTGTGAAGAITFNGTTSFASSSGMTISTNRNIDFVTGSSLLTVNGNISLDANPATAANAVYSGINLPGATVKSTGTGNITMAGKGGAGANTAEANLGIDIYSSSLIQTNSGNITLTGNAGLYDGTADNCIAGIYLDTSDIRSTSGNISLTGNGSSTGSATAGDCDGVNLEVASNIVTGGIGSVSIIGTAKRSGEGVDIQDFTNNTVVSGSGGLLINGSATGSVGVDLAGAGNTYMLLNALSGPIQITGSSERGDGIGAINFQLGNGTVTNLTLTATGGSVTASGDDDGLSLENVSGIVTGTLTINSTSGDTGETEIISSSLQAATISITATTGNSSGLNIEGSTLNSTGNMTISGSCTGGTGGAGDYDGIYIFASSSLTATNTLSLTANAKDDGEGMDVVSSTLSASTLQITATSVNSNAFDITSATFNATNLTVIANTANADAINSDTGTYAVSGNATFTSACSGGTGDNEGAWFGGGTITVGGTLSINATAAAGGEGLQLEAGLVATAASISLTVAADTTASEVIVMNGGSSLTATGASGITATATGSAGSGVRLNAASLLRATNGPLTLTSNRPIVLDTGDLKSDGTGSITLTTDTVTLSGVGAEINAGTGTVTILTKTANYPIQLGAVDSASALALESSELALITAGSLIIGSTANTQPITLAASTSAALAGNLTLRSAGGVQPAAAADDLTLASTKTVSFGSNTPLKITIAGTVPDSGYDRLNVSTKVDLTNTSLSLTGAYTPVAGDVFTIVSAPGGLSGTFNSLANGSTVSFNGRSLLVNYSATTVTLTDPAPVVTTAPSSLTITYGNTASFTAAASGTPAPTVQWQQNDGAGWTNIGGGTGTTLSLSPTVSQSGYLYRAIFTNTYGTATSAVATLTVNQASTTTSVASSANPGSFGSSVTFTATVTSGASGTVTFKDGTTTLGTGTITAGTATFSTASLTAGSHSITAVYAGDSNYASSTSSAVTQVVNQASTTTTVTPSWNPSTVGLAVTLTASVTPGASGNVTFKDGATTIGTGAITSGTATLSTTSLTIGVHSITAVYEGDSNYFSSTSSAFTQVVTAAPVVTGNPVSQAALIGATGTFTASATGFPNPTVQWQSSTNGGTTWAIISGATSTTYTTPALVAGNDGTVYRAVFTNSSGVAVTTTALLRVNQTPTVTTNPADTTASPGTTARFTAAATGWPVPTVQWQKNSGSGWNNISGETGLAYTTSALTVADSGTQFRAVFTNSYGTANSSPATLTVGSVAAVTNVAVGWGSQTANLSEASGGRLLPAGRNKTLPWLGIQQIALTFDQPVPTLAIADIQLTSAGGFTYGITSVTGSGTSWTINLSSGGLANADRVTVSVRNSSVASWNRRLDVLPGDVNDDATVTSVDQLLVSRQVSLTYIKFYDIDGNGLLTAIDFSLIKSRIGKKLP